MSSLVLVEKYPRFEDLSRLSKRIENLQNPDSIRAPVHRWFRYFFNRFGWKTRKPKLEATTLLLQTLKQHHSGSSTRVETYDLLLNSAIHELEINLRQVELATVLHKRKYGGYAQWLRRLHQLIVYAAKALAKLDQGAVAVAALSPAVYTQPPIGNRANNDNSIRTLELKLDTIDHLLEKAGSEELLGRKRNLLFAARQLLLETTAAHGIEGEGVQERTDFIAKEINVLNRFEAAGLRPNVGILHQAQTALSQNRQDVLFTALSYLRQQGVSLGNAGSVSRAAQALDSLNPSTKKDSFDRSVNQMLDRRVVDAIYRGYDQVRHSGADTRPGIPEHWSRSIRDFYAPGKERATLTNALSVDGCFEVGGALSPIQIEENFIYHRVVPFPTEHLKLEQARKSKDLKSAIIRDPRRLLADFATGKLLKKSYLQQEVGTRPKVVRQGEIRFYILDGSGSMLNNRGRMRDALLTAELATLLKRLENPKKDTWVVLYYRYFTDGLGPLNKVDSPGGAIEAIHDVVGTHRDGGTDIQNAIITSLQLIRDESKKDPDLAKAQIVLVTDGEDPNLDENAILQVRRDIDLPVGISVIALGQENRSLQRIVSRQRDRGEKAFYHFLPDSSLSKIVSGDMGANTTIHANSDAIPGDVHSLLEELVTLKRSQEQFVRKGGSEGQQAMLDMSFRQKASVERRYRQWFPVQMPSLANQHQTPQEDTLDKEHLELVQAMLSTITEIVEVVGSSKIERQADAVDLLQRLLPNMGITPMEYKDILRLFPNDVKDVLENLHKAVDVGAGWNFKQKLTA